jgi:putative SOS response-associated peptidase YedK
MCGAYGFAAPDITDVYDRFAIVNTLSDYKPRYNLRPGQLNPVITSHSPNQISRMFWGLLPHFAHDEHYKYKTINAKAETVAQLPTFREPFRHKRCIIPATGFYESDKIHHTKPPFPWHNFTLKEHGLFGFAGLYDVWKDRNSEKEIYSYTIITTEPNGVVGKVHNRMPVILQKKNENEWLNPDIVEPERLLKLLAPYPAAEMAMWPVGEEARNPRNDYAALVKPL